MSPSSHPEWTSVQATVVSAAQAGDAVNIGPPGRDASVHYPWQVRVRFETGYGSMETEGVVYLGRGEQAEAGATLAIRYDPTDPMQFELDRIYEDGSTGGGAGQVMGPPEIAGMPRGEFVAKAIFDPAGTRAHTQAYGMQQMADLQAQMDAAYQQATAHFRSAPTVTDELERLTALHKSGALSDEEFAAAKQRLLG